MFPNYMTQECGKIENTTIYQKGFNSKSLVSKALEIKPVRFLMAPVRTDSIIQLEKGGDSFPA